MRIGLNVHANVTGFCFYVHYPSESLYIEIESSIFMGTVMAKSGKSETFRFRFTLNFPSGIFTSDKRRILNLHNYPD